LHGADRGARPHPRGRRRPRDGARQRCGGAARSRGGAPPACRPSASRTSARATTKLGGADGEQDREFGSNGGRREGPAAFHHRSRCAASRRATASRCRRCRNIARSRARRPTGTWCILGKFAMGGAGIVFVEETAVEERSRKTYSCPGIYTDGQARAWRRITDFLRSQGALSAIQLGHAGAQGRHQSAMGGICAAHGGGRPARQAAVAGLRAEPDFRSGRAPWCRSRWTRPTSGR